MRAAQTKCIHLLNVKIKENLRAKQNITSTYLCRDIHRRKKASGWCREGGGGGGGGGGGTWRIELSGSFAEWLPSPDLGSCSLWVSWRVWSEELNVSGSHLGMATTSNTAKQCMSVNKIEIQKKEPINLISQLFKS